MPEPPDEASFEPEFTPTDADVLDNLLVTRGLFTGHIIEARETHTDSLEYLEATYPPDEEQAVPFQGELLDGTGLINFFEGVVIDEDENGVRFVVPERFIKSERHGIFGLEISGELKYFKEHDDYGQIRFLQKSGQVTGAIWLPHLYPFEPADPKTHLPEILDRERCQVEVRLRSVDEEHELPHNCEIAVHTAQGIFAALPAFDLSYGSGRNHYTEFHWFEHDAVAQQIEIPDLESPSAVNFGTRKSWDNKNGMQAVGQMWVPIDDLRRVIEAQIEFPDFQ